ncbi:putative E3 ubiquitin-protein ligase ARI1 [Abeliophyllum distichum]|uniref:RBR-type E3 ubiquitin transferase n=1 Tax=Abeliophyllum distichum TaxID=126358 RepID=A0ABD1Q7F4_9LAMI
MAEDYGYGSSDDEYNISVYDDDDEQLEETEDENELLRTYGETSCKVIRKESLLAAQKEDLSSVMDLLSLKENHARTLLIHYSWDVDKVLSVFVEKGEEQLYAEAGVSMDNLSSSHVLTKIACQICFEEFPANETTAVNCGHCFCNDCWAEYFTVKINEGQSRRITCMAHKCNAICDEEKIRNLVSARDPRLAEKFDRFLLESYIEDNKRVKWCPSVPHCGNAIRIEKDKYCEVECACGLQFCFTCSSEVHSPCSCLMWELWRRKSHDESATVDWIMANTKYCPKCHKLVEKNGGCNLVRCICGQPFCWLCGGATGHEHNYESIANHECGRYKEEHGAKDARKKVWRYTHYYKRYKAHTDSLVAEANLKEKLQHETVTLEDGEWASRDFSWVRNGFYRLSRSRQILLYSYPFAYYMFGNELFKNEMTEEESAIKQNLFENQQQQLERNVERLSMFLEEPFAEYSESKVMTTKMKIMSLSTVIDNLCKKLYDCIENELLGSLQSEIHIIAPYRSKGVEKASELLNTYSTKTALPEEKY